jgi:hypothetical protein
MSKKLKAALIIAICIVILLALQINANSFRAKSTINSWVETAFQGSTTTIKSKFSAQLNQAQQINQALILLTRAVVDRS